jgi:hypothetical protein
LGLTGSLRFDVSPVVLPSTNNFVTAPFVFNGHATGFAIQDVGARVPLFDVDLVGQGTASVEFDHFIFGRGDDVIGRFDEFGYFFAAAPAATPEPATLALFGTGLVGLIARARTKRRGL